MYLSELTALSGVSGNEGAVRNFIKERITPLCDRIEIDNMGNLLAFKKGRGDSGKLLLLSAHMDEVGLIAGRITDEGFIKFKTVGSLDPRVLISKRVLVGQEQIPGVIGRRAIHLLSAEERKQMPKISDLYVDIGVKNKKEAEKKVKVGDYISFDSAYREFGAGLIKAKALDDRAGCNVLMNLMREDCEWDVCFAFTVQEEVGLRGARILCKRQRPDVAVVVEGTTCSDLPETAENMISTRLSKGAALSYIDAATCYNRPLVNFIYNLAKEQGVPVQIKQTATGGNDAGALHVSGGGIPTAVVSVPARYIHSPASVISKADLNAVEALVKLIIQEVHHA
ncbi:MAG: M20/M25/M40 family metallo-hydrolase [Clostridia bacterium]|nr:M20/M25/M40 family metallo-hydrolase [Clostridia bacterium]